MNRELIVDSTKEQQKLEKSDFNNEEIINKRRKVFVPNSNNQIMDENYLSTQLESVDYYRLDFDNYWICKKTNSSENVCCCLICGTFLQFIDIDSPAWIHTLSENHNIFIELFSLQIIHLNPFFTINDPRFDSIIDNIHPDFDEEYINTFLEFKNKEFKNKKNLQLVLTENGYNAYSLTSLEYPVGLLPINNLNDKKAQYLSCTIYMLYQLTELRNYIILIKKKIFNSVRIPDTDFSIFHEFIIVFKKLSLNNNFKGSVSIQKLLRELNKKNENFFPINYKHRKNASVVFSNPVDCYVWFINFLINYSDYYLQRLGNVSKQLIKNIIKKVASGKLKKFDGSTLNFYRLLINFSEFPQLQKITSQKNKDSIELKELLNIYFQTKQLKVIKYPKYLVIQYNRFEEKNNIKGINDFRVRCSSFNIDLKDYSINENTNSAYYDLILNINYTGQSLNETNKFELNRNESDYLYSLYIKNRNIWYQVNDFTVLEVDLHRVESETCAIQIFKKKK